jgi:hypothetical protein
MTQCDILKSFPWVLLKNPLKFTSKSTKDVEKKSLSRLKFLYDFFFCCKSNLIFKCIILSQAKKKYPQKCVTITTDSDYKLFFFENYNIKFQKNL